MRSCIRNAADLICSWRIRQFLACAQRRQAHVVARRADRVQTSCRSARRCRPPLRDSASAAAPLPAAALRSLTSASTPCPRSSPPCPGSPSTGNRRAEVPIRRVGKRRRHSGGLSSPHAGRTSRAGPGPLRRRQRRHWTVNRTRLPPVWRDAVGEGIRARRAASPELADTITYLSDGAASTAPLLTKQGG